MEGCNVRTGLCRQQGERLAHLHAAYEEIGGYQARARAQTMLSGLGFDEPAQARRLAGNGAALERDAAACGIARPFGAAVDHLVRIDAELDDLIRAWRAGDTDALARVLTSEFDEFPDLYRRLTVDRNRAWAAQLALSEERTETAEA